MDEVVLEVWVRGFNPHERAERRRWIMNSMVHARSRLNDLERDTDLAVISHKFYGLVEVDGPPKKRPSAPERVPK